MKKYLVYLFTYSVLGFMLEKIVNILFTGSYYDNSVLIGPYQPLYGFGVVLLIIIYNVWISKTKGITYWTLLIIIGIATTALSEFVSGESYKLLTGITLWDYGYTFTCSYPFVCIIPTSLFGIISALTVKYLHPFIDSFLNLIPSIIKTALIITLLLDYIYFFIKFI